MTWSAYTGVRNPVCGKSAVERGSGTNHFPETESRTAVCLHERHHPFHPVRGTRCALGTLHEQARASETGRRGIFVYNNGVAC